MYCPQLAMVKRLLGSLEAAVRLDAKQSAARPSTPSDASAEFKKRKTAVILESPDMQTGVGVVRMPAVHDEKSMIISNSQLFFVSGLVQTQAV